MRKKLNRYFLLVFAGFFVFLGLRLLYGYVAYPDGEEHSYEDDSGFRLAIRNFASYNGKSDFDGKMKGPAPDMPNDAVAVGNESSMKYERIGVLKARTEQFSKSEQRVRSLISQYHVLVQFEQNAGLSGRRVLHLGLGVVPEKFDEFVSQLRSVATLRSVSLNKTDKTNEYRELRAKRVSLEKKRDALVALKSRGGSVEESIELENYIFEVEESLQELGVKLGEFDTENEFCTVKFSLSETASLTIPLSSRLKTSVEWTIQFYSLFLFIVVLCLATAALGLVVYEKVRSLIAGRTKPAMPEQPRNTP